MALQENNSPARAFSIWSPETRRRLTIVSVVLTIVGIYWNGAINYVHFLSDRARASADALQSLTIAYGSSVTPNGKSCLEFANADFAQLSDTEAKDVVERMWDGQSARSDRRSFESVKDDTRDLLIQCLAGTELKYPAQDLPGLLPSSDVDRASKIAMARRQIRKQIFGYLNLHETIFDLVRLSKIDTRIICNQLGSDINDRHPLTLFVKNVLRKELGEDELKKGYSGLSWYTKNLNYCSHDGARWFENIIQPILPWFSYRS